MTKKKEIKKDKASDDRIINLIIDMSKELKSAKDELEALKEANPGSITLTLKFEHKVEKKVNGLTKIIQKLRKDIGEHEPFREGPQARAKDTRRKNQLVKIKSQVQAEIRKRKQKKD